MQISQTRIHKKILITGLFTIILLVFNSCFSVKPQSTKSGRNLYETFYVGEEGSQYFIKPLKFDDLSNKTHLFVDFTFRYKDQVKDSATVNFSIFSEAAVRELKSVIFLNKEIEEETNKVNLIFFQKKKEFVESRYTVRLPLKRIIRLFAENDFKIKVINATKEYQFEASSGTKKDLGKIKDNVFNLMIEN